MRKPNEEETKIAEELYKKIEPWITSQRATRQARIAIGRALAKYGDDRQKRERAGWHRVLENKVIMRDTLGGKED